MNKKILVTATLMLLVGLGGGYGYALLQTHQTPTSDAQSGQTQVDAKAAKKPLFYRNPMNPAITTSVPTKDSMGMDYIPVYANDHQDSHASVGTVKIDPTIVQDMGVRTNTVQIKTLSHTIRAVGHVTYDEEHVVRLHPKYDGWVEKMFVDETGQAVDENTMLLSIYSPQLVASQEEYLLALNNQDLLKNSPFKDVREGAASLLQSSKERLKLMDVPHHQIAKLTRSRKVMKGLHIHSPIQGIVMRIGVRDGQRITPNTELYMIADLSRVWILVDVYEDDLPWVRVGDRAAVTVGGIPGRTYHGKVSFIYPYLQAKTRTIQMRLEFENPDLKLKPDMFANVTIQADPQLNAMVIPSEAILRTGEQTQVFVQRSAGKYEPRKVVLGVQSEGQTQILHGLKAGEVVVTSGEFLIDSESNLREATAKMMQVSQAKKQAAAAEGKAKVAGMDMGAMTIPDDMSMEGM